MRCRCRVAFAALTCISSSSSLCLRLACRPVHDTPPPLPPTAAMHDATKQQQTQHADNTTQPSSSAAAAEGQAALHMHHTATSSSPSAASGSHDESVTEQPSSSASSSATSHTPHLSSSSNSYSYTHHYYHTHHHTATAAADAVGEHTSWPAYRVGGATHRMSRPRTAWWLHTSPAQQQQQQRPRAPRTRVIDAAALPSSSSPDTSATHLAAMTATPRTSATPSTRTPPRPATTTSTPQTTTPTSTTLALQQQQQQQQQEERRRQALQRPTPRSKFSFLASFDQGADRPHYSENNYVPNNTPKPLLPMWASSLTSPALGKVRLVPANWISQDVLGTAPDSAVRAFLASLTRALPATCPLHAQLRTTVTLRPRRSSCRGLYAKRPLRRGEVVLSIPLIETAPHDTPTHALLSLRQEEEAQQRAPVMTATAEITTKDTHATAQVADSDASAPLFALNAETLSRNSRAARRRDVPSYDTVAGLVHGQRHGASAPVVHPLFMEQIYLACLLACEKAAGTASPLHAYFALLQSCPYMFDNAHIYEMHHDVLQPAALLEYSDHQRRFLHYLRVVHTHWCQQYERTQKTTKSNSKSDADASASDAVTRRAAFLPYSSAAEPLVQLVSETNTRRGEDNGVQTDNNGNSNDDDAGVHARQRSLGAPDLASFAAATRESSTEAEQSVPAFLLLLSQSASPETTARDMSGQHSNSSSSSGDGDDVYGRAAKHAASCAVAEPQDTDTRMTEASHGTLPPPSLAELEWCLRVVLSRQWMLPVRHHNNSHTALESEAAVRMSDDDDDDQLDAFARAVMRLKRLFYAKVLRVVDEYDETESNNNSNDNNNGGEDRCGGATRSEAVTHDREGDRHSRCAPIATLVPLLDMLQHPPSGVANTRFSVELMPLSSSSSSPSSSSAAAVMSGSTPGNAHADNTTASHGAEADTHMHTSSPATQRDMSDGEAAVPHVVLRASEDIDADDELTLRFSRCYSVAYTLYRYGCLPLRRREDDMNEVLRREGQQQQQQQTKRGECVMHRSIRSAHRPFRRAASLSHARGN